MAKLFLGLNQSLEGYVDYLEFATGPVLFRLFYERARELTGGVCGALIQDDHSRSAPDRRMYYSGGNSYHIVHGRPPRLRIHHGIRHSSRLVLPIRSGA
jgi:hypothetical protein